MLELLLELSELPELELLVVELQLLSGLVGELEDERLEWPPNGLCLSLGSCGFFSEAGVFGRRQRRYLHKKSIVEVYMRDLQLCAG